MSAPQKTEPTQEQLAEAIQAEAELAARAQEARGDADRLDQELFLQLWPLMREKIPDGFITEVTAGDGKPYPSKGVRSLQVQIDRMDAIWTPLWWGWRTDWLQAELAEVTVWVGASRQLDDGTLAPDEDAFVIRKARGGVNRGSTVGNHFKGTETNAGKMAFARLGPGHEVYLGATDFDPDTDDDAAELQERLPVDRAIETIDADSVAKLRDTFDEVAGDDVKGMTKKLKLKLGTMAVTARSVNQGLAQLTPAQAVEVDAWLSEQKDGGE